MPAQDAPRQVFDGHRRCVKHETPTLQISGPESKTRYEPEIMSTPRPCKSPEVTTYSISNQTFVWERTYLWGLVFQITYDVEQDCWKTWALQIVSAPALFQLSQTMRLHTSNAAPLHCQADQLIPLFRRFGAQHAPMKHEGYAPA